MNNMIPWTYPEVEKALTDKRSVEEVAREMPGRSPAAIYYVRSVARYFAQGRPHQVKSKSLQDHFKRYFVNRGNMQFSQTTVESKEQPKPDTCQEHIDKLTVYAETSFASLKRTMVEIAQIVSQHQDHKMVAELETLQRELEAFQREKKEMSAEITRLREFKSQAKQGNFAEMMRRITGNKE